MKLITLLEACKKLHLTKSALLARCRKHGSELVKCKCAKSFLIDEDELKRLSYKKHSQNKEIPSRNVDKFLEITSKLSPSYHLKNKKGV